MRLLQFIFFLALTASVKSQDIKVTYYDSLWRLTIKEFAVYYRVGFLDTKTLKYYGYVNDYYLSGQLQMKGVFNNGIKVDTFYFYYPNGVLKGKGKYENNLRYGIWSSYYNSGQLKDKVGYNGDFICALEYYDEQGNPRMTNGTGWWETEFFDDLVYDLVTIKGNYRDTLRHGEWTSHRQSLIDKTLSEERLECLEIYENGLFSKGEYYYWGKSIERLYRPTMRILPETVKFENLDTWAYTKYASKDAYPFLKFLPKLDSSVFPVDKPAEFPGGIDSLHSMLRGEITLSEKYIKSQKLRSCSFTINIDANGKLKIVSEPGQSIAARDIEYATFYYESLKAIKKLPNWKPAVRGNKYVDNQLDLSINMDDGFITADLINLNSL